MNCLELDQPNEKSMKVPLRKYCRIPHTEINRVQKHTWFAWRIRFFIWFGDFLKPNGTFTPGCFDSYCLLNAMVYFAGMGSTHNSQNIACIACSSLKWVMNALRVLNTSRHLFMGHFFKVSGTGHRVTRSHPRSIIESFTFLLLYRVKIIY